MTLGPPRRTSGRYRSTRKRTKIYLIPAFGWKRSLGAVDAAYQVNDPGEMITETVLTGKKVRCAKTTIIKWSGLSNR